MRNPDNLSRAELLKMIDDLQIVIHYQGVAIEALSKSAVNPPKYCGAPKLRAV